VAALRSSFAEEQGEPSVFPGDVDVAEAWQRHDEVGWPLAEHLVGDPVLAHARVLGLGLHHCLRRIRRRWTWFLGIFGLGDDEV
jgi:hypothetical protein